MNPTGSVTMKSADISPKQQDGAGSIKPRRRGFAAMDPQRLREISGAGGRAAHQSGHAHEFTAKEAREAGRKRHVARSSATDAQGTS